MIRNCLLFLILGGIALQQPLIAQEFVPTPVEISTEKVRVNGTLFYAHVVLKGQTLFSIGKAYQVEVKELQQINPKLSEGLKAGDLLLIPVHPTLPMEKQTKELPEDGDQSRAAVTVSEANVPTPPMDEQDQQVVPVVSAEKKAAYQTVQQMDEKEVRKRFKKHTAKWYETLEDVAEKYDVPADAIVALNDLQTRDLKRRQVLYIPDGDFIRALQQETLMASRSEEDQEFRNHLFPEVPIPNIGLYPERRRTGKISLILPLYAQNPDIRTNRTNATDFYCGFLMGMKHLEDQLGIQEYHLQVIDQGAYLTIEELVYSGVLDGSELIVGPVAATDMNIVASFAQLEQIPIVSPLDAKADSLLQGNPYLFQFPANSQDLTDNVLKRLTVADSAKVTLIYEKGSRQSELVRHKFAELNRLNIPFDSLAYGILEGRGIDIKLGETAHARALNQYVVASENEAFVSDVLRNLHLLRGTGTKIRVFGEIRWKNYQTIEPNYYHDLNLQLPQLYYVDYADPKTAAYVTDYYKTFGAEPTPFAFQGYDIACYFLKLLRTYGWSFPVHVTQMETELVQSGVHFLPIDTNSGFKNTKGRTISYDSDWRITY